MRVIFDTNIFISYLVSPANPERTVVWLIDAAVNGLFTLVLPVDLISELEETIAGKAHLSRAIPMEQRNAFLAVLRGWSETLPSLPGPQPRVTQDPEDDYLLAAATIANVDVLVSGDIHLLELRDRIQKPAIMTAIEFLDRITSPDQAQP